MFTLRLLLLLFMKSATNKNSKKILVLLDAHAIIHRAYHALPDLRTKDGAPTGGLYGIASMLMRIISDLKPDYLAACYDLPEPTFRKQVYDAYKAGRPQIDDDLVLQIERSRDIFTAFGIPIYEHAGFEADDILGTVVEQLKKDKKLSIIIASGDMDTLQLVDDKRVQVYTLRKGLSDTVLYDEATVVERYGFTPELVPDYKGLCGDTSDNIIGVPGIGAKTATELLQKFGSIETIYKKLKKNKELLLHAGIKARVVNLLEENEEEATFSKTLATIRRDAPITFVLPEQSWRTEVDTHKLTQLFDELEFATLKRRALALVGAATEEQNEPKEIEDGENMELYIHARIALWLLNSDKTDVTRGDIRAYTKEKTMKDALSKLEQELTEKELMRVYREIELPLLPILIAAEERGVLVDIKKLEKLSHEYHRQLTTIERRIYELAGEEFNINSPKQVGEILFEKLQLSTKGIGKTGGGALSTRESELEKLREQHPIVGVILEHREIQKLLSTYIDAIPKLVDSNNRLHTHLNQTGSRTGRMSSDSPNLQNIPASEEHGDRIRGAFIAPKGHVLLACDYSQIEMRVLAAMAQDTELITIFKEGKDVHASVAARMFGVREDEVGRDMRRKAKVINFGIIYGMGVQALKKNLGTDLKEAKEFYENYFISFPKISAFFEGVKEYARDHGYTTTYFGRRRYFPDIKSKLPYLRASAERMAMNAPLQGTAADLIKIAMRKADDTLREAGLIDSVHLVLQVHDELMYEVEESVLPRAKKIIIDAMEHAVDFPVPLTVNAAAGPSWADTK